MPYMKKEMSQEDYDKLKPFLKKKFMTHTYYPKEQLLKAMPSFKHDLLDCLVDAGLADENYIYRHHKVNPRLANGTRPMPRPDTEYYGIGLREDT